MQTSDWTAGVFSSIYTVTKKPRSFTTTVDAPDIRKVSNSSGLNSFFLIMCIDVPESTRNCRSSGLFEENANIAWTSIREDNVVSSEFLIFEILAALRTHLSSCKSSSCDHSSNFGANRLRNLTEWMEDFTDNLKDTTFFVRTCGVFPVHDPFWFCLVQMSTTQICGFPPALMANVDDGSDVPICPMPGTSSNYLSLDGDLDGMGSHSSDAQFKELRDILLPLTRGLENFGNQIKTFCEDVGMVTSRITNVEQTVNAFSAKMSLFATMEKNVNTSQKMWTLSLRVHVKLKWMQHPSPLVPARRPLGICSDMVTAQQPLALFGSHGPRSSENKKYKM